MEESNFIGERLKQARIEKGYTLDDLQQLTKIQKRYLIAIEENHLEELPGDFFVNAFIRQYAEVVDISLDEVEEITDKHSPPSDYIQKNYGDNLPSRAELKRSSKETKFQYSSSSQSSLPTFFVVLFFILILGIIWFYFNFMRNPSDEGMIDSNSSHVIVPGDVSSSSAEESSSISEDTVEPIEEPTIIVGESGDGVANYTIQQIPLPNTLTLSVDRTGRSWMQVRIGEEIVFEGVIEPETSTEITIPEDTKDMSIRIGYIPSTTITFGEGLEVPHPENSEIVQTQTFLFQLEAE